jgi:hypothetical protein
VQLHAAGRSRGYVPTIALSVWFAVHLETDEVQPLPGERRRRRRTFASLYPSFSRSSFPEFAPLIIEDERSPGSQPTLSFVDIAKDRKANPLIDSKEARAFVACVEVVEQTGELESTPHSNSTHLTVHGEKPERRQPHHGEDCRRSRLLERFDRLRVILGRTPILRVRG